MPLGTELNLGTGDVLLDGVAASPPPKRATAPRFSVNVLGQGHIVLDGDPAPPAKGAQQTPSFRPMSIVATVARLNYC